MKPKGKNFIPAAVTLLILALPLSAWAAPRPSHPPQRPRPHHHQRHCPPPRPMVRHCPPKVIVLRVSRLLPNTQERALS